MSRRADRLQRWYPRQWRERYGDELAALCEDVLAGDRPSWRFQMSLAKSGMVERARAVGLIGTTASPRDRRRAGVLAVLCAWAVFIMAGSAFAKLSEHGEDRAAASRRWLVEGARRVVGGLAVVAALAVVVGAVVVARPMFRALRGGRLVRRDVVVAVVASALAVGGGVALVVWARRVPAAVRETGGWPYGAGFLAWALAIAVTIGAWTVVAVRVVVAAELSTTQLRTLGVLAHVVGAAMVGMTVAALVWTGTVGGRGSPVDVRFVLVGVAMLAADTLAVAGLRRFRGAG